LVSEGLPVEIGLVIGGPGGQPSGVSFARTTRFLTFRRVQYGKGLRRVVATAALNSTDGGQGSVPPAIIDDAETEFRVRNERSAFEYPNQLFYRVQSLLVRPVA
jgi:hypothetical protein